MEPESIVGVRKVGTVKTIDIEVDNDSHLFFANGIATSNSHSYGYGIISYYTAYCKQHFPIQFYCGWLFYAKDKKPKPKKEVGLLVSDSRRNGIEVVTPRIDKLGLNHNSFAISNDKIFFGAKDIKDVGSIGIDRVQSNIERLEPTLGPLKDWTWTKFLTNAISDGDKAHNVDKDTILGLILCGGFRDFKVSRKKMVFEYNIYRTLTDMERAAILQWTGGEADFKTLLEFITTLPRVAKKYGISTDKRRQKIVEQIGHLAKPPYSLKDTPAWISRQEKEKLGIPITCSQLDACDTSLANSNCKEFEDGRGGKLIIPGEITSVRYWKVKSGNNQGKEMAFVTLTDDTGDMDCVLFTDALEENDHFIWEGNMIMISGERTDKGSFNIQKVFQI